MKMIINKESWNDEYHTSDQINDHVQAIADALGIKTTIERASKEDHYKSRILGFISLMIKANKNGLSVGWAKKDHPDNGGQTCFGGGWVVAWINSPEKNRVAYHIEAKFMKGKQLQSLQKDHATFWDGKDDTISGLKQIQAYLN